MGKISIEDIKEQVESKKWKLLSTEYKNLDTELCFECSEGHKVYNSWKRMRNKLECPVCKQNVFKQDLEKVKEKKKGTIRVLGLDQATNVTGYSIFDNGKLIASGTYTTRSENESKRIKQVRDWVISMINQWQPDYVGIEDIQFQKSDDGFTGIQTFKTLAHLQGVLILAILDCGIVADVVSPSTWRNHCQVKGKTKPDKKKSMQLLVKKWFDMTVSDDESDAIGLGKTVADSKNKSLLVENWE